MLLVVRARRAATQVWPWVPRGHSPNPAKKLSKTQAPPRPRPPATQSPGVPALYWQIGPTMPLGPGPNSWLSFQATVPRGLSLLHSSLEMPEPHPRTPTDIQKETVPFRAVELFRLGEMGMPPPSQDHPYLQRPNRPQTWMLTLSQIPSSTLTLESSPAQGPSVEPHGPSSGSRMATTTYLARKHSRPAGTSMVAITA